MSWQLKIKLLQIKHLLWKCLIADFLSAFWPFDCHQWSSSPAVSDLSDYCWKASCSTLQTFKFWKLKTQNYLSMQWLNNNWPCLQIYWHDLSWQSHSTNTGMWILDVLICAVAVCYSHVLIVRQDTAGENTHFSHRDLNALHSGVSAYFIK